MTGWFATGGQTDLDNFQKKHSTKADSLTFIPFNIQQFWSNSIISNSGRYDENRASFENFLTNFTFDYRLSSTLYICSIFEVFCWLETLKCTHTLWARPQPNTHYNLLYFITINYVKYNKQKMSYGYMDKW